MDRKVIKDLVKWKDSSDRKPLILKGARQVGKTWIMLDFAKKYYNNYVYLNFDENDDLKSIFRNNKNPNRIIELLSLITNEQIIPNDTLIIFDEIQECSEALNSLKYFKEKANEYHIIAAGSLLGTSLAQPKSYPVGMVNILNIYPLTFGEFLAASNQSIYSYYDAIKKETIIEDIFHNKLMDYYNEYLIIGGMPECINSWIKNHDISKVAKIQKELIELYENDFSKYNGKVNAAKLLMIFRNIVTQLAKDNEKFIYGVLRDGARARDFKGAIEWLVSSGIINRIYNVSKIEHPLAVFDELTHFKLFLFDTGLLKQMSGVDNSAILLKSDYQFKGALTENYVLQQLKGQFDVDPRYFSSVNKELDFIVQYGTEIIPIEVKGGEAKSAKSFKTYIKEKNPKIAIRISKRPYKKDDRIINIPLYLADKIKDLI